MRLHFITIKDDNLVTEQESKTFEEMSKIWTEKFIKRDFGL